MILPPLTSGKPVRHPNNTVPDAKSLLRKNIFFEIAIYDPEHRIGRRLRRVHIEHGVDAEHSAAYVHFPDVPDRALLGARSDTVFIDGKAFPVAALFHADQVRPVSPDHSGRRVLFVLSYGLFLL